MRTIPLMILAGALTAGFGGSASAQMPTNLDCGTPQNALEYYCMHRDEFNRPAAAAPNPATTGSTTVRRAPVNRPAVQSTSQKTRTGQR